jgi:hypothetical protein
MDTNELRVFESLIENDFHFQRNPIQPNFGIRVKRKQEDFLRITYR